MFERLRRLYTDGKLTVDKLSNAVILGWITDSQKQEILTGR